jgi:hypothetical protein
MTISYYDDDDDSYKNDNTYEHGTQTELSDFTLHVRFLCFLFHEPLASAELFIFRRETFRQYATVKPGWEYLLRS